MRVCTVAALCISCSARQLPPLTFGATLVLKRLGLPRPRDSVIL